MVRGAKHTPRPVRLIGAPTDRNSSFRRGPAKAPAAIRTELHSTKGNAATELGGEFGIDLELRDAGDLPLVESPADDQLIESAVANAFARGEAPLLLGGDHSITYPVLRAVARARPGVSILHIDAHSDIYDALDGNSRSHASPFARIMEAGLASRLVQVGIRTLNAEQRLQVERFKVEMVSMRGFDVSRVPALSGPVYVSIDLDGIDPAHAPGVSHQEPGGLTVREVMDLLATLSTVEVVGADVVELNPDCDINGMTAAVAAKLVKELAALLSRSS
jgi:agmatinase